MAKKAIKLVDLLKLSICQRCPDARKKERDKTLMCHWNADKGEITKCADVPSCGNWPDYFADEIFNQIKVPFECF